MDDYDTALKELFLVDRFRTKLGMERIAAALERMGNPQERIKVIHVGGTNGKGSTCTMIAAILKEAGYKVGLFLSPFLRDFRESISIDGEWIAKDDVVRLYRAAKEAGPDLTYFELKTAIAYTHMEQNRVDFAVIEVGLGGRLDATNVCIPLVSIITNVGLEHKEILGDTIEKIAAEKAGIIKKGRPVVTLDENPGLDVIRKVAEEMSAEIHVVRCNGNLETGLVGEFQKKNASLAFEAIKVLNEVYGFDISDCDIQKGLKHAYIHGRMETIRVGGKRIMLDCAHNPPAFDILGKEVGKLVFGRLIVVMTMLKDKEKDAMIRNIEKYADMFIVTEVDNPRASKAEDIAQNISKAVSIRRTPKEAMQYAIECAEESDLILVTGSCYLVGEILNEIHK